MTVRVRRRLAAGFAAAVVPIVTTAYVAVAHPDAPLHGTWRIAYETASKIDLDLSFHSGFSSWETGETIAFDTREFTGLTLDAIKNSHGDKHFQIVRDAGTFDCNGYFSEGIGSGVFDFAPNASFGTALSARGLGRPSDKDQFVLALSDVTLAMVDGLRSAGVTGLSVSSLVTLVNHAVTAKYVSDLKLAGVRPVSVDDLVRLRDHGVNAEFVADLVRSQYHPSIDDLVRLRDHGVDADFVSGMIRYGYRPSADDLVRLRDHGVDLKFVARLQSHGYHPSIEDLIRLRDSGI